MVIATPALLVAISAIAIHIAIVVRMGITWIIQLSRVYLSTATMFLAKYARTTLFVPLVNRIIAIMEMLVQLELARVHHHRPQCLLLLERLLEGPLWVW